MALETWLIKVKMAISNGFDSGKTSSATKAIYQHHPRKLLRKTSLRSKYIGVLAFEVANIMSKLLHLHQSLSDANIIRLRNESISLEGVRKIVSNDESFLLSLACAEFTENLRNIAASVSRLTHRCSDSSNLKSFDRLFQEFANSGCDPHGRILPSSKEIEARHKKMEHYVTLTAILHRQMDELSVMEKGLKKALQSCEQHDSTLLPIKEQKVLDLQQKIAWLRQEVKDLKYKSLWNKSFVNVVSLLVRSVFTALARIKLVFGFGHSVSLPALSRSLSASAVVYPSDHQVPSSIDNHFISGPLKNLKLEKKNDFFESHSKLLKPPGSTLGAAALALHYANLIIVMEKMIKSPQLIGVDARDDLYAMLPNSIRCSLRKRLKGVTFSASDPVLAGEWRDALGRILGWLSPLAHNMIKWQSERSFEQHNVVPKTNVLLLQTLIFANKEKTEAAITELLVGLNYVWKFEREMTAKALFNSKVASSMVGVEFAEVIQTRRNISFSIFA